MDVIASGDVYNPGGRSKVPRLFTIDTPFEQKLGDLEEQEAFRLSKREHRVIASDGETKTKVQCVGEIGASTFPSAMRVIESRTGKEKALQQLRTDEKFKPLDMFEILSKKRGRSIVRTSRGYVTELPHETIVHRQSNLARSPDGYSESKVALASFPVAHVVSHRTLWVRRQESDDLSPSGVYITAFVGDLLASPHFMVRIRVKSALQCPFSFYPCLLIFRICPLRDIAALLEPASMP